MPAMQGRVECGYTQVIYGTGIILSTLIRLPYAHSNYPIERKSLLACAEQCTNMHYCLRFLNYNFYVEVQIRSLC